MRYIAEDATLRFKFNTRRFSTGAPYTLAGTPSLAVYAEDSDTQITAGITLTVDYDSVTGLNNVVIDLSASASYAAGKKYEVVIEAGTVDSVSVVGAVVYEFYIHASGGLESLITRALLALPAAAADAAGGLPISDAGGLDLDTLNSNVSAILADTGTDGVVVAAGSKTGYSLTATTGLGDQTANITGNLSGSVGSVTGSVGSISGVTFPTNFSALSIDSNGRVDIIKVAGTTQTAANMSGMIDTINTNVLFMQGDVTVIYGKFTGITSLAGWLRALVRSDAAFTADDPTSITEINEDLSSGAGSYVATTDSLQANRDNIGAAGAGLTDLGGFSTTAKGQINAEVLDVVGTDTLVAGVTIKESLRRIGALTSGIVTNAGSGSETFKDYAESANTIVITVDASGNRSAITYN